MFSLLAMPYNTFEPTQHLPIVSSPLSSSPIRPSTSPLAPRDANIPGKTYSMSSPTPSKKSDIDWNGSSSGNCTRRNEPAAFAKRRIKSNPLLERNGGDDGRETRRKLFLKRVREDSEDKRWKARGGDDELMRVLWVAEQRRREERKAREAQYTPDVEEDDNAVDRDELLADEVARMEQEELEALIASMELPNEQDQRSASNGGEQSQTFMQTSDPSDNSFASQAQLPPQSQMSYTTTETSEMLDTPFGSDDDEYDHLFTEILSDEAHLSQPSTQTIKAEEYEMMDMS